MQLKFIIKLFSKTFSSSYFTISIYVIIGYLVHTTQNWIIKLPKEGILFCCFMRLEVVSLFSIIGHPVSTDKKLQWKCSIENFMIKYIFFYHPSQTKNIFSKQWRCINCSVITFILPKRKLLHFNTEEIFLNIYCFPCSFHHNHHLHQALFFPLLNTHFQQEELKKQSCKGE